MVEISEVKYGKWGNCVRMSDGKYELLATLDFGPRIIRYSAIGKENIFFEDINDEVNAYAYEKESNEMFGDKNGVWHIFGGHRLWLSPESVPATYYPDNEPVSYEKIENGIVLMPPAQRVIDVQLSIEITMLGENCVRLVHKIKNIGKKPLTFAPWAMSVMSKGGTVIFPVPERETGLVENRHLVLWPYTKMTDKRVYWGDKYITLKQDPENKDKFKLGQLSQHGWAAYFNHGDAFVKYFSVMEDQNHPDRNCNFETFTSDVMLEVESIGELAEVQPGEIAELIECWSYYTDVKLPTNEREIELFADSI